MQKAFKGLEKAISEIKGTEMKLSDACKLIVDCPHSTAKDEGTGYPLIRTPNIGRGRLKLDGVHRVSENVYLDRNQRATPQTNDLILAREAPVGNVAVIKDEKVCLGQRTVLIRPDEKKVDADFLVYYLLAPKQQHLLLSASNGATVSHLNMSAIRNLEIDLPEMDKQKRMGRILSKLDDLIVENERINKNLLEQAQAIYTKMFITDADSLWPEGKLSDLIEVCYGKDHKKLHDGDIPVYGSGGIMRHVDRALYEQESVLVPRKGTLNNVMYVNEPFWSVDTMFFTKMKRQNVAKFVFHFLKGKDLAAMNAGSAVPSMTTKILNAIPLQIPDDQTLSTFEAQVSPFYQAASYNNKESENLAAIRDSLLPKLMSGEIDVSDIDL